LTKSGNYGTRRVLPYAITAESDLKGGERSMQCALCNEPIEDFEFDLDELVLCEEEIWHADCLEEYVGDEED
jgi:hypothetical protein